MPVIQYQNTLSFAQTCDNNDPLRSYRDQFHIPQHNGQDCIYLVGNSLGLQPKSTRSYIEQELQDWQDLGVEGHFDERATRPWFHYHKFLKSHLAKLAGAKEMEVVSMNSLTTNLHLMMVSFYRPTAKRFKIITEAGAFPSDQYALETQLHFHANKGGVKLFDPAEALVELKPREGEETLRTEDILAAIEEHKDELALVMMAGVQYYTGQLFDISAITKKGHECGALVGFDLAHAFGNVPLNLHDDQVDFAVWCSYKYLNSGPGSVSGVFVHERHSKKPDLPRFAGWWGHDESQRFQMKKGFVPMEGADAWQLSNVNVLPSAAHLASLEIFSEAGIENLRKKSIELTGYMEFLLNELNGEEEKIQIITPADPKQRGAQLSLCLAHGGKDLFNKLGENGIIADWREPNVIRVAAVPMYNSFEDVWRFVDLLKKLLIS
ncbi:MAG: kynureninase [Reichenbachiella sp.]|uniref:kynureninase n=1 Tax=Reichenbachiella sp. TaxID=2184521 RepID=UPI003296837C